MLPASAFLILNGGALGISKVVHQHNEDIRDKEVRLIGEDGEQLGILSSEQALEIAEERGLDLVKISPQAVPPVCKLMNYGKFRFEQSKREKEAKKNQHTVEIKEIRMSPGIDVGDFNTKLKNAQKFLSEGNRVKVSVRFRGREMAHTEIVCRKLHRDGQFGEERQAGGTQYVHLPGPQGGEVINVPTAPTGARMNLEGVTLCLN